jgi:hypothetical protein
MEHILGKLLELAVMKLFELLERGVGSLDVWFQQRFGRSLSGHMNKLEIQTLFNGNTKDQDQI